MPVFNINVQILFRNPELEHLMSQLLDDTQALKDAVQAQTGAINSAIALISGFSALIVGAQSAIAEGASADTVLEELKATVDANTVALATAVAANPLPQADTPLPPAANPAQ